MYPYLVLATCIKGQFHKGPPALGIVVHHFEIGNCQLPAVLPCRRVNCKGAVLLEPTGNFALRPILIRFPLYPWAGYHPPAAVEYRHITPPGYGIIPIILQKMLYLFTLGKYHYPAGLPVETVHNIHPCLPTISPVSSVWLGSIDILIEERMGSHFIETT